MSRCTWKMRIKGKVEGINNLHEMLIKKEILGKEFVRTDDARQTFINGIPATYSESVNPVFASIATSTFSGTCLWEADQQESAHDSFKYLLALISYNQNLVIEIHMYFDDSVQEIFIFDKGKVEESKGTCRYIMLGSMPGAVDEWRHKETCIKSEMDMLQKAIEEREEKAFKEFKKRYKLPKHTAKEDILRLGGDEWNEWKQTARKIIGEKKLAYKEIESKRQVEFNLWKLKYGFHDEMGLSSLENMKSMIAVEGLRQDFFI